VPYEQAFEAIKAGIDSLAQGVKMVLNSGGHLERYLRSLLRLACTAEFYDNNRSITNIDLISAFFEKYPDYADKVFLSVKVCWRATIICLSGLIFPMQGGLVEDGSAVDSS
jgi:pyridoxine 4-dehydrogenase